MRRREFVALLGSMAAAPRLPARAQTSAAPMPIVTVINGWSADAGAALANEFRKGLSQTGFVDGKNVVVEYHWLDGHYEEIHQILEDAIRRNVAVIATPASSPAARAAKTATATIPIVFGVGSNPVALGLVASLAKPGTNATGINFFASEIDAKRLELMHELVPTAKRIAVLVNPANPETAKPTSTALMTVAPALGLELIFHTARTPAEIDAAFTAIAADRVDALFIAPDALFGTRGAQLVALTARYRLPTTTFSSHLVVAGLLMSYGTSIAEVFRQVAVYTGSILKGAKPADLPVLQSTKFELVINRQTASSLDLDVPPKLLALADEVIE